jgi:hypothetical protein
MFNKFSRGVLTDRATDGGGAATAPKVDPGAPYVVGEDEPAKPAKAAEPSETEKRISALEKDLASTKANLEEAKRSEQFWADKARGANQPQPEPEEEEAEPVPTRRAAAEEKPEALLNDLSIEGAQALWKRGVITEEQLFEHMKGVEARVLKAVDKKFEQNQRYSAVDSELAKYPDLIDDSKRVAAGQPAKTELYQRAAINLRQMIADDPALKNSPGALLTAVRMADKELKLEAKAKERQAPDSNERRQRIELQQGERPGAGSSEEDGEQDQLSPTQRTIVNNLSRFGANEEGFRANLKNGTTVGRHR